MEKRIQFSAPAFEDITRALAYYKQKAPGQENRFLNYLKEGLRAIGDFPEAFPPVEDQSYRKYAIHTFPFSLIYEVTGDRIFIIALQHHSRGPEYKG